MVMQDGAIGAQRQLKGLQKLKEVEWLSIELNVSLNLLRLALSDIGFGQDHDTHT